MHLDDFICLAQPQNATEANTVLSRCGKKNHQQVACTLQQLLVAGAQDCCWSFESACHSYHPCELLEYRASHQHNLDGQLAPVTPGKVHFAICQVCLVHQSTSHANTAAGSRVYHVCGNHCCCLESAFAISAASVCMIVSLLILYNR